jgi:hypothetical protein
MWQYYVITELRVIFQDDLKNIQDQRFVLQKELKFFVNYNGNLDSDESDYENSVNQYYQDQLKKYDKIIYLYSEGSYIKEKYKSKYHDRIIRLINNNNHLEDSNNNLILVTKSKYTEIKL